MENKNQQSTMAEFTEKWDTISPLIEAIGKVYEPKPPTLKERILSIPYHLAYYLSYPFLWLAYQLWQGIEDAYLDSWDKE